MMKTAKEMRELALTKKPSITKILAQIESEAKKGHTDMWYYELLDPSQRQQLSDLGYIVSETVPDRNEYLTKISWA